MSVSLVLFKTVDSVELVFGLDWFAILGGAVTREVKRIAGQQKATHAVYGGNDAASVGVAALHSGKRSTALYSAAQLVAQRFPTGVVALIVQLDDQQWWLVAVHEGAVVARTDSVCLSQEHARERIAQLRQAYPNLRVINDEDGPLSLSSLIETLHGEARLRRITHGSRLFSRRYYGWVLLSVMIYLLYRTVLSGDFFGGRDVSLSSGIDADQAWTEALRDLTDAHWVHGVAGSTGVLLSLYGLPVQLEGWRLTHAECTSERAQWRCHADYDRDDPETSNDRFLGAAKASWDVSFTPLEQARVRWSFASAGRGMEQTALRGAQHIERSLFSALQAIRPAFALMVIDAPERLPVRAPFDEHGHAIPEPPGLPAYRLRPVRIQAPLRSISLLLPHTRQMSWRRVILSLNAQVRPDLTHSRLNVILQGVLYEQD